MNTPKKLTPRQLSLAECACLEAQGDMERLDSAIRNALGNGVTVNELKEAFSQLYAYTGFPRSLNALNKLKAILDERKTQGINDNEGKPWNRPAVWDDASAALEQGTRVQSRLVGGGTYNYEFCPQDDYYLKSHLFGDIFAGDLLSDAEGLTLKSEFPQGNPNVRFAQYFQGKSYLAPLSPKNLSEEETTVQSYSNVTFEPGCRNNWHIHHGAHQILICVSGKGWYQEWGKPAIALETGDIIDIPEGVKHWHGAQKDSWFQHIATHVKTGPEEYNEWLEAVNDEDYLSL